MNREERQARAAAYRVAHRELLLTEPAA